MSIDHDEGDVVSVPIASEDAMTSGLTIWETDSNSPHALTIPGLCCFVLAHATGLTKVILSVLGQLGWLPI